jgi:prepilin-type N-terminal cleavage/methylation domain-containing protein
MPMSGKTQSRAARSGFTLIEVAIAAVVLAALAIGAGALYHQSWGQVSIQRNKRAALVAANARMELIRATNYTQVAPPGKDYATYYLAPAAGAWVYANGNPGETVSINGQSLPITTTVQYMDADPGNMAATFDYLSVRVAVAYRRDPTSPDGASPDRVVLETLIAP